MRLPRRTRVSAAAVSAERTAPLQTLGSAAFAALICLSLLGPLMTMWNEAGDTNVLLRQAGYCVIFLAALAAIRPLAHPERLAAIPLPVVALLVWSWVSLTWAIDPGIALRRIALTTIVAWTLFALVRRIGHERCLMIVRVALVGALVASYAMVLLDPATGIHQAADMDDAALTGYWRGAMGHKNTAGLTCALIIALFLFDAARIPIVVRIAIVLAAAGFLVMSASKTSLALLLPSLAIGYGLAWLAVRAGRRGIIAPDAMAGSGWRMAIVSAAIGLVLAVAVLLALRGQAVGGFLADRGALSGRAMIWDALIRYCLDHPWLGSGYGSFWGIGAASPIHRYASGWVTEIAQGHNGFLDILAQLGLAGLGLALGAVLVWPLIRLFRAPDAPLDRLALPMAILVFGIGNNMSETSLFDRDTIGNVFILLAIALLAGAGTAGRSGSDRPRSDGGRGAAGGSAIRWHRDEPA